MINNSIETYEYELESNIGFVAVHGNLCKTA